MGESQSRYSIVERLIQQKLQIMNNQLILKNDITQLSNEVETMVNTFAEQKKILFEETKRNKKALQRELDNKKIELKDKKNSFEEQNKLYLEQIDAINNALDRIEHISKLSDSDKSLS